MTFLAILGVTLPLAAVIALGFLAVWRGWFPRAAIPGVGAFVRNFAIPAAIFAAPWPVAARARAGLVPQYEGWWL